MTKIKKSFLITLDFPPNYGGVASYYYQLVKNMPPEKIVVLAPKINNSEKFDLHEKFTIIRSESLSKIAKSKGGLFNIKSKITWLALAEEIKILAKNHAVEILLIGQVLPLGHLGLILKKKFPYIVFTHGMDITVPAKIWRKKILLKKILSFSKEIVANSYFTRHEINLLGIKKEKIHVIYPCPNLIPSHIGQEEINEFLRNHELVGKKIILTLGRLVERKGHDQIIKAMPQILKKIPEAFYLIAGSGPYKNELEKIISKNNLGRSVKFIDNPNPEIVPILYQACDLMAMPSRALKNGDVEGFGIVYLEANAFGKPVLGGKSGGIPEAIINERTGLIVNPNDSLEIAQAIISLLINPAYAQKIGLQGMDRVHEEFNWSNQAKKLTEIL